MAAAPIRVVEVNANSSGTLNYADHDKTGLNVIAVGGFSLSRGLTLEGLMVSYFLRNSMMYDTLMQMGRWFGYRPEYDDLCRIWMPEEAEAWYAHIAESIELLREELRRMEAVGATPEEFGLKVRSHPDTLVVTARNKLGSGQRIVVNIGLGNNFIETYFLKRDAGSLLGNRTAVRQLASDLAESGFPVSAAERVSGGWLLRSAPVGPVLNFISRFQNHPGAMYTDPGPVRRYIEDRQDTELAAWDILFASTRGGEPTITDTSLGLEIHCQRRSAGVASDGGTLRITNKQRVASRGVEKTGVTAQQIAAAEEWYREQRLEQGRPLADGVSINYPDRAYRFQRERPLLIIHLLKIDRGARGSEESEPVVAYGISFPRTGMEEKRVEYVVNTTWVRENYREDFEDDELNSDNDDV